MRQLATTLVFLLPPSALKNRLLRLLGHDIHPSARIGPSLVLGATHFRLAARSRLGAFNSFRTLRSVSLGEGAAIANFNWFSGSEDWAEQEGACQITFGTESQVLSRHLFDCSGGITLGNFSVIGGYRSIFITHEVDYRINRVVAGPIVIGDYCLINAANYFIKDAYLPDRCITAIGSLVRSGLEATDRLYGGIPARELSVLEDVPYFTRDRGPVRSQVTRPPLP